MANFLLILREPPDTGLSGRIQGNYPNHWKVANNAWVIRSKESTDEISKTIFPEGNVIAHLVIKISAYWGRHSRKLWEWMGTE